MTQPVYFVVQSRHGFESSAIYYDRLPIWMTGKHARTMGLVYALRLDTLDDAERWVNASLGDLHRTYIRLRKRKALPPSNLAGAPARLLVEG